MCGEPLQVLGAGPVTPDGVGALDRTGAATVERRHFPPASEGVVNDRPAQEPGTAHHENPHGVAPATKHRAGIIPSLLTSG